ncbi:MAG TPA: nuclear transport factor 2 family protein [Humisphaera sp.]
MQTTTTQADTTTVDVPEAVAAYLAAERSKDVTLLDNCFADDAVVHDEGGDHRGLPAIRRWKAEADEKYGFTMTPLAARTAGDAVTVRGRVAGNFPGSPIELDFRFTLAGPKASRLDVTPT